MDNTGASKKHFHGIVAVAAILVHKSIVLFIPAMPNPRLLVRALKKVQIWCHVELSEFTNISSLVVRFRRLKTVRTRRGYPWLLQRHIAVRPGRGHIVDW